MMRVQAADPDADLVHVGLSHQQRPGLPESTNGLSVLARPFKLRLRRASGERAELKDYASNIILVEPLATLNAIEDFLYPRVHKPPSGPATPAGGAPGSGAAPTRRSGRLTGGAENMDADEKEEEEDTEMEEAEEEEEGDSEEDFDDDELDDDEDGEEDVPEPIRTAPAPDPESSRPTQPKPNTLLRSQVTTRRKEVARHRPAVTRRRVKQGPDDERPSAAPPPPDEPDAEAREPDASPAEASSPPSTSPITAPSPGADAPSQPEATVPSSRDEPDPGPADPESDRADDDAIRRFLAAFIAKHGRPRHRCTRVLRAMR